MPAKSDVPIKLQPYTFHRVELDYSGTKEPQGTCPFCGNDKFYVSRDKGLYSCKVGSCGVTGNVITFIRELHARSFEDTRDGYDEVSENRRINVETLREWGLCRSIIDQEWILPAYGPKGEINNLYRWSQLKGGKRRLLSTSTLNTYLFGLQFWDESKPDVYLQEGPWDGMTLRLALSQYARRGNKLVRSMSDVLLNNANVLAVPGCETFRDEWLDFFRGKNVYVGYDNDYPKETKNGIRPPAGTECMRRVGRKVKPVVKSFNYFHWGDEGFDPTLADGFDARDFLTQEDAETTTSISG